MIFLTIIKTIVRVSLLLVISNKIDCDFRKAKKLAYLFSSLLSVLVSINYAVLFSSCNCDICLLVTDNKQLKSKWVPGDGFYSETPLHKSRLAKYTFRKNCKFTANLPSVRKTVIWVCAPQFSPGSSLIWWKTVCSTK